MKKGILLFNLGGPSALRDVKPFLYRLFSDPDILVGIPSPFRQAMAFVIAQLKGSSSEKMYASIGGGSPQLKWTKLQAQGLSEELLAVRQDVWVEIGMRASEPSIEAGLTSLMQKDVQELLLFPLFPHFSKTTTGSCFKEAYRLLQHFGKTRGWRPTVCEIRSWQTHPAYLDMLETVTTEAIEKASDQEKPLHVLFSAHSLPLKIVQTGDPYPVQVDQTVQAITSRFAEKFNTSRISWSLAFQSRNGPMPWLKPYVEEEIPRLAALGIRSLVIVPMSFVSDHIETLYELDQLYAKQAKDRGIAFYSRARSFNDDPQFIRTLAQIVGDSRATKP